MIKTVYILDLISVGMIAVNKVIGYNQTALDAQNVDLPFPSSVPFPLTNINNAALVGECYFAIIGDEPSTWAAANGLSFGTTTSVT